MKFFYALLTALLTSTVYAQQPFQGTIVYALRSDLDENDAELSVQYGVNKIKVKIIIKNDAGPNYMLVDLDSGKIFNVDASQKTFVANLLYESKNEEDQPSRKNIAGFNTSPITTAGNAISAFLPGLFAEKTTFYVANDLYYPVPEKYWKAPELMMINSNHIVLGVTITGQLKTVMSDTIKRTVITAEAKKIEKRNFELTEFSIPNDYKPFDPSAYMAADSAMMLDTMVVMPDTIAAPKVKTPAKTDTKPKPAPKKTTPSKTEAIKPRKTQTKT